MPVRWAIAGRVELEVVAFQLTAVGGKAPNRGGEATDVVGLGETEAEAFGVVGKGGELEAGTHPGDGRGDDGEGDVQRRSSIRIVRTENPSKEQSGGRGSVGTRGRPGHGESLLSGDLGQSLVGTGGVDVVGSSEGGRFQAGEGSPIDEAG